MRKSLALILTPLFVICQLMLFAPVEAQQTPSFSVRVSARSANVRAAPSVDAALVGSVFAEDALNAIGRNMDGSWIEIERPAGWIRRDTVVFTFDLTLLPITDLTTGVTGNTPVTDTGFAVQVIDDTVLRAAPERAAAEVTSIPIFTVLPVLERTPDNQWLLVNYRGVTGWLPQFLTRYTFVLNDLPVSPAFTDDPRYPPVTVIPVETQLAQIDRLLAYIEPLDTLADGVANYWNGLRRGQIFECQPHTETIEYYTITPQDLIELPELRQQERFLIQAVDDLNAALAPTQSCSIVISVDFQAAYADAINARAIFRMIRRRMDALRLRIDPTAQTG